MHHCLLVTEIVHYIFDWLSIRSSRANSPTLLSLATTCRTFQHPALDVLWRDLDPSFAPLIKTLPRDLWEQRRNSGNKLFLRRALVEEDLRILRSYASRIRTFELSGILTSGEVSIEVFQALSLCMETPLLPNLRELCWLPIEDALFPFIRMFLGGRDLHRITLGFLEPVMMKLTLLPFLKVTHPPIKDGRLLTIDVTSEATINAISDLVSGWAHLERLKCGPLTQRAWSHLAALPALRKLDVELSAAAVFLPNTRAFSALRSLSLRPHHLASTSGFLNQMPSSTVKTLIIDPVAATTNVLFKEIMESIKSNMRHLTSITFHEFFSAPPGFPDGYTIKIDAIKPLFSLQKLVHVELNPLSAFYLDDAGLKEIALAWPSIVSLDLGSTHGWRRRSKLTLKSLLIIVAHCPHLQDLGIVIDATKVESYSAVKPGAGLTHERVRELRFGDSRVGDSAVVAAFLSDIMPSVQSVSAWDSMEMERREGGKKYGRRWREVERLLTTFTMVREQERNWREITRARTRSDSANTSGLSLLPSDPSSDSEDASTEGSQ